MDGDDFYEDPSLRVKRPENCYYQNNQVHLDSGPSQRPEPPSSDFPRFPHPKDSHRQEKTSKFLIVRWSVLFCAIIGIFSLLIVITLKTKDTQDYSSITTTSSLPVSGNAESSTIAESCNNLRNQGVSEDGIYEIQPNKESFKFHTFCDMTTGGGGWTLVASIHENDIKSKCDSNDVWSTYVTRDSVARLGKETWENNVIFGDVNQVTDADYKNRGYFQINASDIMIWHVANGVHVDGIKKSASLKYRTTNNFLQNYGGNLQNLYKRYPVRPVSESEYNKVLQNRTGKLLEALSRRAVAIINHISDWHQYTYDNRYGTRITGDSMYGSYGNQINFQCGSLQYGQYRQCDDSSFIASADTHPFFAIAAISNEKRKSYSIGISVYMYRPTSTNNYTYTTNVLENGNFKLQYQLVQFSTTGYNTVSEFYFIVTNTQDWNSIEPISFTRSGTSGSGNTYKYSNVYANNYPSNFIMGYVLLARKYGKTVQPDQANNVAREILEEYSSLPNLFSDFTDESLSVTVPVTFDKGSTSDVLQMIPSNFKSNVQTGFLQFRPFNKFGYPNALCPGIKTKYSFPEYLCIGGVSQDIDNFGTCGDLAGWEGHAIAGTSNPDHGSSHNHNDISTTFLIFYR